MKRNYGIVAEFDSAEQLIDAVKEARARGYRRMEAFSPLPVEGLDELVHGEYVLLPPPWRLLSAAVLCAGVLGCVLAFVLQYWTAAIYYPLNVGGRPLNSWPTFIIICFELTILFAAGAAFVGLLVLAKLSGPYHPIFDAPNFSGASKDRYLLCLKTSNPMFDGDEARAFLSNLNARSVHAAVR